MRGATAGLLLVAIVAGTADAQDAMTEQRRRLARARANSAAAVARASALEADAARARTAATRSRTEAAAIAARIAAAEQDIFAARARVAIVDRLLAEQRTALATHQGPVARLLGALQSLARRPAIAAVVQPGSVDDLVHVRAVLGSALPAMRQQTADLRQDLARTRTLEADAALAQSTLLTGRAQLTRQRTALAAAALVQQDRAGTLERRAMAESDRAIALVEEASDITDDLTDSGTAAATAALLRHYPGPPPGPGRDVATTPAYRLPVAGRLIRGLGEMSPSGVRSRGLTLAPPAGSTVIAPAAGRIALVRPFRRYGTIVILDHGQGWTTLVTGLASALRVRGEAVPSGAALGRAGSGEPQVTVELRRHGRPVDIAALIG